MKKILSIFTLVICALITFSFTSTDVNNNTTNDEVALEQGDWNYATTSCGEGWDRSTIRLRYKTNGGNGLFALEYRSGNGWFATDWHMSDHRFACPKLLGYSGCSCFGY